MKRILLIDEHRAVLDLLAFAVGGWPEFSVVGAARSLAEVAGIAADIAVVELCNAGPACSHALTGQPKVVVFTGALKPTAVKRALALGAHGFVSKQSSLDDLRRCLQAVAAGEVYFSPDAEAALQAPSAPAVRLSPRDEAVLRDLAEGLTSKEISTHLCVTAHVVNNIRLRTMRRARLRGTAQLVRYAVSLGLVGDL